MLRAFLAACAVGVIALTLFLGTQHRPTIVITLPAPPPLSRSVAAPVLSAPHRVRVVTPRTIVTKQHTVRLAPVAKPQFAAQIRPARRTRTIPTPPTPGVPPVTHTPAPPTTPTSPTTPATPTTPTPPVAPSPAPPVVPPASPPVVDTTPSAPTSQPLESPPETTPTPPVVTPPVVTPPPADTRPGNGWGDKNHVHTGPPGHGG